MSNPLLPGDVVRVAKGRNQRTGKVIFTTAKNVCVDGIWVLLSSIDPKSIKTAQRLRKLAEINASFPATEHVTLAWLSDGLSEAEVDAWLGL